MNKCEELKIEHAWRKKDIMYGFSTLVEETCANCGLKRTHCSKFEEWYSYSDGHPIEIIHNIRPL